jgi:hypothetical protein
MTTEEIKQKTTALLKKYGVTRAAVFGSVARGESTTNDVDILVELGKDLGLLEFVGLKQELESILHAPVDLVEYDAIKPRLREQILSTQVPIYET